MSVSLNSTSSSGQRLSLLSDSSLTQLVNDALRNYQSTLALSRSPLANSALVTPTLVKDEASPTAEERGHGLRLLLQWAVNQLAPAAPTYALGDYRPLDDPTWRDPRWWRYNILRHRYLEPLHPDDFVGSGRYTESLIALTGISSNDGFFDERNRAIREVANQLRQQLIDGHANGELQRLALQEALLPLSKSSDAANLLAVAAIFDDIFPRSLLLEIARQTITSNLDAVLDDLIGQRFLLTGDQGANLWLSPVLRSYVYEHQSKLALQRYHRIAATYYEKQGVTLLTARHWQRAKQDDRAARLLLVAANDLVHELQVKELCELLKQLDRQQLAGEQWYDVQVLLSDLFQRSGQHEEAMATCRQALKASSEVGKQASVYRRMGKLYESRNQLHSLRYYQQAIELFPLGDIELAETLKDRGWLYFYRQEWSKAEIDLLQALRVTPEKKTLLRADIYDAMANLYRKMDKPDQALTYAQRSLAIREEDGDLLRIAKSLGNLGFLYRTMNEYANAIAAHKEALNTYQKIGTQELMATALLNIGATEFLAGQTNGAIQTYQQSLTLSQSIGLPLIEIKARYNLVEALTAFDRRDEAKTHWRTGLQLCRQHAFDDQEADFLEIGKTLQLLPAIDSVTSQGDGSARFDLQTPTTYRLDPDEQEVLTLAQREPKLTAQRLIAAANISRATATRRLTALVEKGILRMEGKGRGVYYQLVGATQPTAQTRSTVLPATNQIAALLGKHQAQLRQQYSIEAIGNLPASMPERPIVKLTVRFQQLPDLARYLELRQHLSQLLQMDVDLLPEL